MRPFEIFITYVSWGIDGKRRPVVIYSTLTNTVDVFRITTQYLNKSAAVRANYLALIDWQQAGLDKQSYIDIGAVVRLPKSSVDPSPIGMLSERDKIALIEYLEAGYYKP